MITICTNKEIISQSIDLEFIDNEIDKEIAIDEFISIMNNIVFDYICESERQLSQENLNANECFETDSNFHSWRGTPKEGYLIYCKNKELSNRLEKESVEKFDKIIKDLFKGN